jgi:hypothetical protein
LLYKQLAVRLEDDIHSHGLRPGDRFDSIQTVCRRFQVSGATAVRAVDVLKDRGVLVSVPKKGTFVNGTATPAETPRPAPLRSVIIIHSRPLRGTGFIEAICTAAFGACQERGLGFRLEVVDDAIATPGVRLPFTPQPGDGVITFSSAAMPLATLALLRTPGLRRVVVDGVVPFAPCVLTDNSDGVTTLLTHLQELGHRRVLLGDIATDHPNPVNENQRREAFRRETARLGLQGEVVAAAAPAELLGRFTGGHRPTAVMFMQDDPALAFIAAAEAAGLTVPGDISVTGFDNVAFAPRHCPLTTYAVATAALGEQAVAALQHLDPALASDCRWHLVAGDLIVGESTAHLSPGQTEDADA